MKIDNRWMVLFALAAGAAVGTALAQKRRGNLRTAKALEHKQDLKAWENEGGNLAPALAARP